MARARSSSGTRGAGCRRAIPPSAWRRATSPSSLEGHKLAGQWHLVRLKPRRGEKRDNWLLIKVDDAAARHDEDILESAPNSVKSGLERRGDRQRQGGESQGLGQDQAAGSEMSARRRKPAPAKQRPRQDEGGPPTRCRASSNPASRRLQEKPPAGENWLHEVKFDGYRLQARIEDGKVDAADPLRARLDRALRRDAGRGAGAICLARRR